MINNTIALADHVPRFHLVYHRLKLTLSHATQRTLRRALASAAPSWDSLSPPHLPMPFSTAVVIMAGVATSHTVSARFATPPRYECDADGFRLSISSSSLALTQPPLSYIRPCRPRRHDSDSRCIACVFLSTISIFIHADPTLHASLDCRQHRLQLLTCHHCHHVGPCGLR